MASSSQFGVVVREVSRLFRGGTVTGFSEGQLLDRFVSTRDEAAFEALLARHGPMVLGVCRRVLDDPSDVEDAFQATFLVLVKRAGALRDRELLANWLYGVALKVARRARGTAARRRVREKHEETEAIMPEPGGDDQSELRAILDDEIARLPEKFRAPVLLCYLQGLTHDQAADRMKCPVGTVRSRLSKAREVLRGRLTRRGAAPTASLLAADRLVGAAPEVPYALIQTTIQAASQLAGGQALAAGAVSASTALLTEGALKAMALKKIMTVATVVATLGAVTVGGSRLVAQQSGDSLPGNAIQEQDRDELIDSLRKELRLAKAQIAVQTMKIEALTKRLDQLQASAKSPGTDRRASSLPDTSSAVGAGGSSNSLPGMGRGTGSMMSMGGGGSFGTAGQMGTSAMGAGPGAGRAGMAGSSAMAGRPGMGSPGGVTIPGPGGMVGMSATGPSGPGMMMGGGGMSNSRPSGTDSRKASRRSRSVPSFLEGPYKTIITAPGNGEQVKVQHVESGEVHAYKAVDGEKVLPILSAGLLAIQAEGPEVTKVAVYDFEHMAWVPMELKEPIKNGKASPVILGNTVYYPIGHQIYAFGVPAHRWDTLTLDEEPPAPIQYSGDWAYFVNNHLHVFNAKSGRWEDIEVK